MISVSKRQRGITLIELLVVISIMMTVLGLVAPLGVEFVDKARAQTEFVKLNGLIKKYSNEAFNNASAVTMVMAERSITIQQGRHEPRIIDFELLDFGAEQMLHINRNGFPGQAALQVNVAQAEKTIDLSALLDVYRPYDQ